MIEKIKIVFNSIIFFLKTPYFGFIYGHSYLTKQNLASIELLIGSEDEKIVNKFEEKFQKVIGGSGECVAYAAARMGFYDLMRVLDIDHNSEIILTGSTCSVMANAVLKIGASPIYSDIDPNTFGSSYDSIKNCITTKTKIIVAQHSFGIPCDIDNIKNLAKDKGIFLFEDCALTLGSKVDGKSVGNFGDAALFSTDHTKPINTFTGGVIYTRNSHLYKKLRHQRDSSKNIPVRKERAIFRRIKLESKICNPNFSGRIFLFNIIQIFKNKILGFESPFLSLDSYSLPVDNIDYPYPSKMPSSLAQLGIYEIERWNKSVINRRELFNSILNELNNKNIRAYLPNAYYDSALYIVPLRFVWSDSDCYNYKSKIAEFIDIDSVWFLKPIVSTNENIENYGYKIGSCPISEELGPWMFNLPCNVDPKYWGELIKKIKSL